MRPKAARRPQGKVILVGHSFGASMFLRYLAETVRRTELAADIRDLALRRAFAASQKN
jgi:predicted alpha/beta-fold hydrolase